MSRDKISDILEATNSTIKDAKQEERLLLADYQKMLTNLNDTNKNQENVGNIKRKALLRKFYACLKTYLVLFTERKMSKSRTPSDSMHPLCPESREIQVEIPEASIAKLRNTHSRKEDSNICEFKESISSVYSEIKDLDCMEDKTPLVELNEPTTSGSDSIYQNLIDDSINSFEPACDLCEIPGEDTLDSYHETSKSGTDILDLADKINVLAHNSCESTNGNVSLSTETEPVRDIVKPATKTSDSNILPAVESLESYFKNVKPDIYDLESTYEKEMEATDTIDSLHENVKPTTDTIESTLETTRLTNDAQESYYVNANPAIHTLKLASDNETPETTLLESSKKSAIQSVDLITKYSNDPSRQATAGLQTPGSSESNNNAQLSEGDKSYKHMSEPKLNTLQSFKDALEKSEFILHNLFSSELKMCARNIVLKYRQYILKLEQFKTEVKERLKTWTYLQTCIERLKDAAKVLIYFNAHTFLLIGCSGNGKSSTGNSILQKACFPINNMSSHTMSSLARANAFLDGEIIEIIDGPSIDVNHTSEDILKNSIRNVTETLTFCDFSFNGILLIFQYGMRYTKQESLAVKVLKGLLGDKVISDCGVCIFTQGDLFDSDIKNEDIHCSFREWCKEQEGEIQHLFQECNYRCLLFDNKTKEEYKLKAQIERFLALRNELKSYSKFDYEHSKKKREMFELEVERPEIRKEIDRKVLEIRFKLQRLELKHDISRDEKLEELNIFLTELNKFQTTIPTSERNCFQLVTSLSMEITSKIQLMELDKHLEISESVSEKDNERKTETVTNTKLGVKQKLQKFLKSFV